MKMTAAVRRQALALAGVPTSTAPKRRRFRRPVELAEPAIAVEVLLPLVTRSESNLRRWQRRSRRTQQAASAWAVVVGLYGLARIRVPLPARVVLTRRGGRILDDDNLRSALKATRDQVAAWLGVDDGDQQAAAWHYGQQPGGPYGVLVRVEVATFPTYPATPA
jgi:hypothetical protein